ncbi:MAG TPA: hypothetical protein VM223_09350 [Planctomycetota bacterium]|nr:hypothetical protein [Planctomycetota bacterium]
MTTALPSEETGERKYPYLWTLDELGAAWDACGRAGADLAAALRRVDGLAVELCFVDRMFDRPRDVLTRQLGGWLAPEGWKELLLRAVEAHGGGGRAEDALELLRRALQRAAVQAGVKREDAINREYEALVRGKDGEPSSREKAKVSRRYTPLKVVVTQLLILAQHEPYSTADHSEPRLAARLGCSRDNVRKALGKGKVCSPQIDALAEWSRSPGTKAPRRVFVHTASQMASTMVADGGQVDSVLSAAEAEADTTADLFDDDVDVHFRKIRNLALEKGEQENVKEMDAMNAAERRDLVRACMANERYSNLVVPDRRIDRK